MEGTLNNIQSNPRAVSQVLLSSFNLTNVSNVFWQDGAAKTHKFKINKYSLIKIFIMHLIDKKDRNTISLPSVEIASYHKL